MNILLPITVRAAALLTGTVWCLGSHLRAETGSATTAPATTMDLMSDTWPATDALGRELPDSRQCRPPQRGKRVGIFYFLWHDVKSGNVCDITKLLAANPDNPAWGPLHAFHHWGESELGYYLIEDEFVIRRHAMMLTNAGVDMIIFDATNGFTYAREYNKLCAVYEQMRAENMATPQAAFFVYNADYAATARKVYDDLYAKGRHKDLWFIWNGKPLLLAPLAKMPQDLKDFFTIRESWAWTNREGWFGNGKDKWAWLDHYPQQPGWHESPDKPEQISVCVAQHPTSNIGRSFHDGAEPPPEQLRTAEGLCFDEQWRRALQVDPEFILITGWNEWIAQRFISEKGGGKMLGRTLKPGDTFFVDQYNPEYSRDIEPMKGGHTDNYYYQMAANIRRYKGVRPVPAASAPKSVVIDGAFDDWTDVQPEYRDAPFDTMHRDHAGFANANHYADQTGRNDFIRLKAASDDKFVFFYAETREPITEPKGNNWMLLFIDADQDHKTGWEGYDFRVNGQIIDDTKTVIDKYTTGPDGRASWKKAGVIDYRRAGNKIELAIPRAIPGIGNNSAVKLDFHFVDNIQRSDDIAEFSLHGDSAPDRRFNYRHTTGR
ncbi:MAG: hypothetical protein WCK47_13925 [bacterium]|nr:hypothetical protein [Candidatus Sumerlaeota bacterium]